MKYLIDFLTQVYHICKTYALGGVAAIMFLSAMSMCFIAVIVHLAKDKKIR